MSKSAGYPFIVIFAIRDIRKAVVAIREYAKTDKNNLQALELIRDKRKADWTYQEVADKLNELQYKTSKGGTFEAITVRKLLERSEKWA